MSLLSETALEAAPKAAGPRAVVFDLDGTLVDSVPDIHAAVAAFLAERGHPPLDLATVTGFVGNGVPVLLERVLRAVGEAADPADVQAALPRFNAIYGAAPAALSRLYPGVATALATLCEAGFTLGVCTNKPEDPARRLPKDLGIAGFFPAPTRGDPELTVEDQWQRRSLWEERARRAVAIALASLYPRADNMHEGE